MNRIRLIVGLTTSHRTYLTTKKTRKEGQGPSRAVVPLMMMMMESAIASLVYDFGQLNRTHFLVHHK
jgi:hypothetical protein